MGAASRSGSAAHLADGPTVHGAAHRAARSTRRRGDGAAARRRRRGIAQERHRLRALWGSRGDADRYRGAPRARGPGTPRRGVSQGAAHLRAAIRVGGGRAEARAVLGEGVADGGSTAGGQHGGGVTDGEVVGGGGGRRAPPLLLRARRASQRTAIVVFRLEDRFQHSLGFLPVEILRRSGPVEDRRAPGVDGDASESEQPEEAAEGTPADREEQDQVGRVVEREPASKLVVTGVLVEEPRDRYRRGREPQRNPEARLLFREEEQEPGWCGDEEAHPLPVEGEAQWIALDAGEQQEGRLQVARQVLEAEEAVRTDLLVDAVRIQMAVPELARVPEPGGGHQPHGNGDRGEGNREEGEQARRSAQPLGERLPDLRAIEPAASRDRFEREEDGREQ